MARMANTAKHQKSAVSALKFSDMNELERSAGISENRMPNLVHSIMSLLEHGESHEDTVIKISEILLANKLNVEKDTKEELESASAMEQSEPAKHDTVKNSPQKRGSEERKKRKTIKNSQGEPKETRSNSEEDLETGVKTAEQHRPTQCTESEVQKKKLTLKAILLKEIPKMQPGK